jgi:hypothetical protein
MWDFGALTEDDIDEMVRSAGQPARQAMATDCDE